MLVLAYSVSSGLCSALQIARNLLPAPQIEDLSAAKSVAPQTMTEKLFGEIIAQGSFFSH